MDSPRQPSEVFQLLMAEFHDRLIVIFRCMADLSKDGFEALQAALNVGAHVRT
jgi:hypothetical protein